MTYLLALLYASVVGSFGFLVARRLLYVRSVPGTLALTAITGPAVLMVLTNASAYVLPHPALFVAPFILMATADAILLFVRASDPYDPTRWLSIGILLFVGLVIGFTHSRLLPSDFTSWGQAPLAASMTQGNVPPLEVTGPWHRMHYHYGPELLVASFSVITGLDLLAGYNPQPLLSAIALLGFVFAIVMQGTKSQKTATWGAMLAIAGGGLAWLSGSALTRDLYHAFILGEAVHGPFRGLFQMTYSPVTNPIGIWFVHRSTAIGYALLYGLIATTIESIRSEKAEGWWVALSVIFGSALSLTMEIGLAAFLGGAALFSAALVCSPHTTIRRTRAWRNMVIIVLGTMIVTLVQGGMLSPFGGGKGAGSLIPHLTLWFEPWGARRFMVGEWLFLRDFGLPLILLPWTLWFCQKRHKEHPEFLLLLGTGLAFFLAPLLTRFTPRPYEMLRFFWGATSFFSLLAGIMIGETLLISDRRWRRMSGVAMLVSMLVCSALYFAMTAPFPTHHFEHSPLFARMPKAATDPLVSWVREHTTQSDWFYVRPIAEQAMFSSTTGRFTIGPRYGDDFPQEMLHIIASIEHACAVSDFRALNIAYLVISTEERARWFDRTCTRSAWELVMDRGTAQAPFPRIYKPVSEAL